MRLVRSSSSPMSLQVGVRDRGRFRGDEVRPHAGTRIQAALDKDLMLVCM